MFRLLKNTVVRLAPFATVGSAARPRLSSSVLLSASKVLSSQRHLLLSTISTTRGGGEQEYETLSAPAPGSPFHFAFPVHDLEAAKHFYGTVLGCQEGRSSEKWQDYSLHGHQIVAHWVGNDYRCQDYYNAVDGDEVPVPHTGLALTVDQFHDLANRLKEHGIEFIIEPHLRFEGQPGEQYTMVSFVSHKGHPRPFYAVCVSIFSQLRLYCSSSRTLQGTTWSLKR